MSPLLLQAEEAALSPELRLLINSVLGKKLAEEFNNYKSASAHPKFILNISRRNVMVEMN